jgi:hypothetical protein
MTMLILIDGQVRLVHLVCLQMNDFRLYFCQQTDKQQISICTVSKRQGNSPGLLCSLLKWQHIYIYGKRN